MNTQQSNGFARPVASLYSRSIKTPLGTMVAVSDAEKLYLLEFIDIKNLKDHTKKLQIILKAIGLKNTHKSFLINNTIMPIRSIQKEITAYFNGTLTTFQTPIHLIGSPFQKTVWQELCKTPYGKTRSYQELAHAIDNPQACRAVGTANGNNHLAIIIPCHRVIATDGTLSGYNAGIERKKWLLNHEKQFKCF